MALPQDHQRHSLAKLPCMQYRSTGASGGSRLGFESGWQARPVRFWGAADILGPCHSSVHEHICIG